MKDYFNYIEDYLAGKLDASEKADMERALAQNEELRLAVEHHSLAKDISEGILENEIRNMIAETEEESDLDSSEKKIDSELKSENVTNNLNYGRNPSNVNAIRVPLARRVRWWWLALAAIFVVIALLWERLGGEEDGEVKNKTEIYAEVLKIYEFPVFSGNRGVDGQETTLDSAVYYFELRDFEKSRAVYNNLSQLAKEDEKARTLNRHLFIHEQEFERYQSELKRIDSLPENEQNVLRILISN